jgi:hypothetical protein
MVTMDEVDGLILGLRLVTQRGDEDLECAADDALAKIVAVLPQEMEDVAATSGLLAGPGASAATPHLALIRHAIRAEEKLWLRYIEKKALRPSGRSGRSPSASSRPLRCSPPGVKNGAIFAISAWTASPTRTSPANVTRGGAASCWPSGA